MNSDDDDNVDQRFPTQAKLQFSQSELLKSADNQPSFKTNMIHQLQQTGLSNNLLKPKSLRKIR